MTEDAHRDFLRLLLCVIDGDDAGAHEIIAATDTAAFAHFCAHKLVSAFSVEGKDLLRADIAQELMEGWPDD